MERGQAVTLRRRTFYSRSRGSTVHSTLREALEVATRDSGKCVQGISDCREISQQKKPGSPTQFSSPHPRCPQYPLGFPRISHPLRRPDSPESRHVQQHTDRDGAQGSATTGRDAAILLIYRFAINQLCGLLSTAALLECVGDGVGDGIFYRQVIVGESCV